MFLLSSLSCGHKNAADVLTVELCQKTHGPARQLISKSERHVGR